MRVDSLNEQTALLVHFNDFRLRDNRPLVEAYRTYSRVVSVVVIDPEQFTRTAFGMPRYSARRVAWYLDAIRDLRRGYRERGGELLVRVGRPVSELGRLVNETGAVALFGQGAKTDEESRQLRAIEHGLPNTRCVWQWNDVLVSPENWPVPAWSFPRSFTGFRKKFESRSTVDRPLDVPRLHEETALEPGKIPSLQALGFEEPSSDPRSLIATLEPGESGAWRQLQAYVWREDRLRQYKQTRNGMTHWGDSSKLSPYLALGLISAKSVYHEVLRYERERVSNQSTYWLRFELLWREYFHALAMACGNTLFHREGVNGVSLPWSADHEAFVRWTQGQTGVPIVDACMRELAATGFSSNRARQIAAAFLTRYLRIDWRWGAAWFEAQLVDHDPCCNWGNWQYVAGVGTGPRDRAMSMRRQADRYDEGHVFTQTWVPELRGLASDFIQSRTPWSPEDWHPRRVPRGATAPHSGDNPV